MRLTLLPVLLSLGGCTDWTAIAAPNPLNQQPGTAPTAGQQPAMARSSTPLRTVDFVKPGARLIYYGGSSTKSTQPGKGTSAGVGMSVFDVVAVTPTKVLFTVRTYLGTGQKDGNYTFSGATGTSISGLDVTAGNALWMPPDELKALRSGNGVQVSRNGYPLGGQTYDAISIFIAGNDSASRQVFDAGTGLKLATQDASGPMLQGHKDPFMRHNQVFSSYESYRQIDLWRGTPPAWVQTVQKLSYSGTAAMAGTPIGMSTTYEVTDRGPGWLQTRMTQQTQSFGQSSAPSVGTTVEGNGKPFGLWVSPEVLGRLRPGVVDRDPTLNTTVSYQVQNGPMGQLGVFSETNARQTYSLVAGYSLQDGVLSYAQSVQRDTGYTVTLQLQGRQ